MRWGRHVARVGEKVDLYGVLVEKPEARSSLGRPRCRQDDNIKIYVKYVGIGDWIY
jgi:hypothetical protein